MKKRATATLSFVLLIMILAVTAHAEVLNETGKVCFSDNDANGFSEHMSFASANHFIFSVWPDDPLGDFAGDSAVCSKPKSYVVFPDLDLTGEEGYVPSGSSCNDGELWLEDKTVDDGYVLYLLDESTCNYVEAMKMDVIIYKAPVSNWCPTSAFAFEFNHAVVNNFIGSPLLDYFASQPEEPYSWASVTMTSDTIYDIGNAIKTGQNFCADAEFALFPGQNCRGCDDCGVESNGRMKDVMAKRHYMRGRAAVCSDPSGEGVLCDRVSVLARPLVSSDHIDLAKLVPNFAALNLQAIPTSPSDLVEITNAVDIIAMDHFKDNVVNGAMLLLETKNRVYEHTKAICDRFSGAALEHVMEIHAKGMVFPVAVLSDPGEKTRSFAVSFAVADNTVFSRWMIEDYPTFDNDESMYNVQLWSGSPIETQRLLVAELEHLEEVFGTLNYDSESRKYRSPKAYMMAAKKHGITTNLHLAGRDAANLKARIDYYPEEDAQNPVSVTVDVPENGKVETVLPPYLDAMVALMDSEGNTLDTAYVSDGSFTAFDDSEFNGSSATSSLINSGCIRRKDTTDDDLIITGCGQMNGKVEQYAVLARVMEGGMGPLDMTQYKAISFDYKSNTNIVLCLESQSRYDQAQSCLTIPARDELTKIWIPLDEFTIYGSTEPAVINDVVALSWNAWKTEGATEKFNADFSVGSVTMRSESEALSGYDQISAKSHYITGCQQSSHNGLAGILLMLVGMLFIARRRLAVKAK